MANLKNDKDLYLQGIKNFAAANKANKDAKIKKQQAKSKNLREVSAKKSKAVEIDRAATAQKAKKAAERAKAEAARKAAVANVNAAKKTPPKSGYGATSKAAARSARDIKKTVQTSNTSLSAKKSSGYKKMPPLLTNPTPESKPLPKPTKRNISASAKNGSRLSDNSQKKWEKTKKDTLEAIKKDIQGSDYVYPDDTTARDHYDDNPYTKEKQAKMWENMANEDGVSGTFGRSLVGASTGMVDANTALASLIASKVTGKDVNIAERMGLTLPEEAIASGIDQTTAYKVGNLGGNLIGYGAQNVIAAPAISGILAKTGLGAKAANIGSKIANGSKIGSAIGEEALQRFTQGAVRNAVESGTVGLAQNIGMAGQEGKTGAEFVKDVALNTLLDLGVGTGLEAAPLLWKGTKAAGKTAKEAVTAKKTKSAELKEIWDKAAGLTTDESGKVLGEVQGRYEVRGNDIDIPVIKDKSTVKRMPPKGKKWSAAETASKPSYIKADTVEPSHKAIYEEYIDSVNTDVVNYAEMVLQGKKPSKAISLQVNSEKNVSRIKELTGVDTTDFKTVLSADEVIHINKRHGSHGTANHSMEHMEDLGRVEWVIDNCDNIEIGNRLSKNKKNADNSRAKQVVYSKKVDGHVYVVEAVPDNQTKTMYITSMYIEKSKKMPPKQTRAEYGKSPQPTSETYLPESMVNSNISQNAGNVKKMPPKGERVGKATVIQNPYSGDVPIQTTKNGKTVKVKAGTMGDIDSLLENMDHASLKRELTEVFGSPRTVKVEGLQFGGKDYNVRVHKKVIKKVLSSNSNRENIALIGYIDDIIKNGEYVGSGKYIQHHSTQKETIRFDYFETPIVIDGKEYVARFDVEVFPDGNNYKTHNVVEINLAHTSATDTSPYPAATKVEPSYTDNISQNTGNVKKMPPKGTAHNGKPLKPNGVDVLRADMSVEEIAEVYGTFKDSEVPKATSHGDVMQGANTLHYAKMMDEKAQEALRDGVKAGDYWKATKKNSDVMNAAKKSVAQDADVVADEFFSVMKAGKQATSDDIAKGYALAEKYIADGEYAKVESVLADVAAMESEAGRTLQAMRIFQSQSPAGRVKSSLRTVENLEKSKKIKLEIDESLLDGIATATTDAEKAAANKAFAEHIWNQIPASLGEKLNAWRYLSMLGNPKTHIRNVLGNAIFVPARMMSDVIATGTEKALAKRITKLSGGSVKGSKAIVGHTGADRELRKLAKSEFKNQRAAMEAASSKYFDSMRPQDAKLYKFKPLEGARKLNSAALEAEDQIFMGINFESAYAQYCKANGKTASEVTGAFRQEAIEYAQRRALEATYRDPNRLADAIGKFKKNFKPKPEDTAIIKFGKTAGEIISESVLPFVKTPANILKRGVEYSPAGVVGGLVKIANAKDVGSLMKGIEYFASGLTGTGVMALGMYAASQGIVNGSMGGYDKDTAYKQMLGEQNYAVHVGDYTFTVDWMAPLSMPFFVGVEAVSGSKEDFDIWKSIESLSTITEPLFEMSMLSGIDNVFDTAFSEGSPIVNIGKNAVQNYISQYIPTMFGQAARTFTKDRKTTMSTAETKLERWTNKSTDKLLNKVPGLTEVNQPYIDQWGRRDSKKTNSDYGMSAIENFFSPGYISKKNETPVDKEILSLGKRLDETDAKAIIPAIDSDAYKVKFKGKEYTMSESEFTKYKETVGKDRYKKLDNLFASKAYKNASDAEKKKMITNIYEESTDVGKKEYLINSGTATEETYAQTQITSKAQREAMQGGASAVDLVKASQAIKTAGATKSIEKAYALLDYDKKVTDAYVSERSMQAAKWLKQTGVSVKTLNSVAKNCDANENGSYSVDEITDYLDRTGKYTTAQKAAIFYALAQSNVKYNPYN